VLTFASVMAALSFAVLVMTEPYRQHHHGLADAGDVGEQKDGAL
jgi:hypothetical protein